MSNVEAVFSDAVRRKAIPGAILCASDSSGAFPYQKTFGYDSPEPDAGKFSKDLLIWAASSTKLLTSIAFMKAVDLGLIGVSDRVDVVLPELASPQILSQAEDGAVRNNPAHTSITFRHLLTHTSGFAYIFAEPLIQEWVKHNAPPVRSSVVEKFNHPLRYEPGTDWSYGPSIDWAGLAVERVSGVNLESFLRTHVYDPVGVVENGITFFPGRLAGAHISTLAERNPTTKQLRSAAAKLAERVSDVHCLGGQGAFAQAPEYLKVMKSVLANDEKILSTKNVEELFKPQLDYDIASKMKRVVFSNPFAERAMARSMKQDEGINYGLGGILDLSGKTGWRGRGTMMWGGAPNIVWFIDREKDLCGFMGMQVEPMYDEFCTGLKEEFEKAMYELAGKTNDG
jgi:CubicO group peptidase (beta-lactamase class C family)